MREDGYGRVACKICGRKVYEAKASRLCRWCFDVEYSIDHYLASANGRKSIRARLEKAEKEYGSK